MSTKDGLDKCLLHASIMMVEDTMVCVETGLVADQASSTS